MTEDASDRLFDNEHRGIEAQCKLQCPALLGRFSVRGATAIGHLVFDLAASPRNGKLNVRFPPFPVVTLISSFPPKAAISVVEAFQLIADISLACGVPIWDCRIVVIVIAITES